MPNITCTHSQIEVVYIATPYNALDDLDKQKVIDVIQNIGYRVYSRLKNLFATVRVVAPVLESCLPGYQETLEPARWLLADLYMMNICNTFVYMVYKNHTKKSAGILAEIGYMKTMSYTRPVNYAGISFDVIGNRYVFTNSTKELRRMFSDVLDNGKASMLYEWRYTELITKD